MNSCVFMGRLVQEPEFTELQSGQFVARFGLAITRFYKQEKHTDYLDFQAWGKTAEFVTKHFHKGDPCIVQGSARVDKWTSKEGEPRRKIIFNVDRVNFVPGKFTQEGQEDVPSEVQAEATEF